MEKLATKKYSKKHIGSSYLSLDGYTIDIVDGGTKEGYATVRINEWEAERRLTYVKAGRVRNPYHPAVCGIGFVGEGNYSYRDNRFIYSRWHSMLVRCYDPNYHKVNPTYREVTVCSEWHNFQEFAKWFDRYFPKEFRSWQIDKDFLSKKKKVYSPQTCIFVPLEVNSFGTNNQSSNTMGVPGLSNSGRTDGFEVTLRVGTNKKKYIGTFKSKVMAAEAYYDAREERARELRRFYSFDYPKYILERIR